MTDNPSSSPRTHRLRSAVADTFSPRSRKQFLLFAAGSAFLLLSTSITRRALLKRRLATYPQQFSFSHLHGQPSHLSPLSNVSGPFEALQALNLATLNVAAAAMMAVGGTLWAFDISSLEEMRKKIRGGLGVDGTGRSEGEVEEEFEEWVATVLSRKEDKERRREEERKKGQGGGEWKNERGKER